MDEWNKKHTITLEVEAKDSKGEVARSGETTNDWWASAKFTTNDRGEKLLIVVAKRIRKKCKLIYGLLPDIRIIANRRKDDRYYQMEPVRQGFRGASSHCDFGYQALIPWTDIMNQDLGTIDGRTSNLCFTVDVHVRSYPVFISERYIEIIEAQPLGDLSLDFSCLLESGAFSDFTINLDNGESMRLHKNVLATRSPVFKRMFDAGMKETQDNNVDIKHIDHCIVKKFIKYLYTSRMDSNKHCTTMELFKLADFYDVAPLKSMCEVELIMRLTPETAADILILADTYNAPYFRDCALKRVTICKSCLYTPALVDALIQRPKLLTDLLKVVGDSATKG